MTKKRLLFTCLFCCIALCSLYFTPLFDKVLCWQLESSLAKFSTTPLSYESAEYHNGKLTIKNLNLELQGKQSSYISELKITPTFEILKRNIALEVEAYGVDLQLYKTEALPFFQEERGSSWINITLNPSIIEGKVSLEATKSVHFELLNSKELFLSSEESRVKLHFFNSETRIDLEHTRLEDWIPFITVFYPQLPSSLKSIQGLANGHLTLKRNDLVSPYLEGNVELKELKISSPIFDFKTQIPYAKVVLRQSNTVNTSIHASMISNIISNTEMKCMLNEPGQLSAYTQEATRWQMVDILGEILFAQQEIRIDFQGVLQGRPTTLTVQAPIEETSLQAITAALHITTPGEHQGNIEFHLEQQRLSGFLRDINHEELVLLQDVIGTAFPILNDIQLNKGIISADFYADLEDNRWKKLVFDKVILDHVDFTYQKQKMAGTVQEVKGDMILERAKHGESIIQTAHLQISDGSIAYEWQGKERRFNDLFSLMEVQDQKLSNTSVSFTHRGLEASGVFRGFEADDVLSFSLSGEASELIDAIPPSTLEKMLQNFQHNFINVNANVSKIQDGFAIDGNLIIDHSRSDEARFVFAFDLLNALTEKISHPFTTVQPSLLPSLALPEKKQATIYQKRDSSNYEITNGWFRSSQISLIKYLSPVVFAPMDMDISGFGQVEGHFDATSLFLSYSAKDILLNHSDFAVMLSSLGKGEDPSPTHYIDFVSGQQIGLLPVQNANYLEKNTGLSFIHTNTLIEIEEKGLKLHHIDTECENIALKGKIHIDLTTPYEMHLHTKLHHLEGRFSDMQNLVQHFDATIFGAFPLNAYIMSRSENDYLSIHTGSGPSSVQAHLEGILLDGQMDIEGLRASVKDLTMQFEYNHAKRNLECHGGQGVLVVGEADEKEHYTLTLPQLTLTSLPEEQVSFNIHIEDAVHDLVHLKGKAFSSRDDHSSVSFHFDEEECFIGHLKPYIKELKLQNWSKLLAYDISTKVDSKLIFLDILRFEKLFPPSMMLRYKDLLDSTSYHGTLDTHLKYEALNEKLSFQFTGENLVLLGKEIQKFHCNGAYQDHLLDIYKLKTEEVNIQTRIKTSAHLCNVLNFDMHFARSSLLSLEGLLDLRKREFQIHHGTAIIDLDDLPFYPWYGQIQVVGKGTLSASTKGQALKFDSQVLLSHQNFSINGLSFAHGDNIPCHLSSDSLSIGNNKGTLRGIQGEECSIPFAFQAFNYQMKQHSWGFDQLSFSLFPHDIPSLVKLSEIQTSPKLLSTLKELRQGQALSGTVDLVSQNNIISTKLSLEDAAYYLCNTRLPLKDIYLHNDSESLQVEALYAHENQWIPITLSTEATQLDHGELTLYDKREQNYAPLQILWERSSTGGGINIRSIAGSFSGLAVKMYVDEAQTNQENSLLIGGMLIDLEKLLPLLPKQLTQQIKRFGMRGTYEIYGEWTFSKNDFSNISFEGKINGKDTELMNFHVKNFQAQIASTPSAIDVNKLMFNDLAGAINIEQMQVRKSKDNRWVVDIPNIKIEDLRPSLLRENSQSEKKPKPLVIKHININAIHGYADDDRSFTGFGDLQFSNKTKSDYHALWTLPTDLFSRLGLDVSLLIPVSGNMEFTLVDAKAIFTRFKNIYSHGKGSQFYLSTPESYVSFNGDVHMQIRMKQYNLFFKLAELLTIHVGGNIREPSYSFQGKDELAATNMEN